MEIGRVLLAGLASGSLMGVLFLGLAASALVSQPSAAGPLLALAQREGGPVKASFLLVALAVVLAWSLIGLLFGLVYLQVAQAYPRSGLASPNAFYSAGVASLSAIVVAFAALSWRRFTGTAIAMGTGLALIFGWLLPWLAT